MSDNPSETVPVAVVGGGVVGVTLALMLANRGVATTVFEQETAPQTLPRAHAVNPRSNEILSELGIEYEELRSIAAPRALTREVRFVSSLTGYCFGSIPYERQDNAVLDFTPRPLLNIPQPALEQLLFDRAARHPLIDMRPGHTWVGVVHEEDGWVRSSVEAAWPYDVRSRYLVAADGAGSPVREALGIAMSATMKASAALSITFEADLTQHVRDRPGTLHWVFGAQPGVFVAYYPDRMWGFSAPMPPGPIDMTRYGPDRVSEMVRAALGPAAESTPIDIIAAKPWTMRCEVADAYRYGNVFLAGDAAHRFPPTGGLGLNTGIQDAHNLAWKLAATLEGWALDSLLDTYHHERQPIAARNAEQSRRNAKAMTALRFLDEVALLDNGSAIDTWLREGDRSARVAEAIDLQRDHFDSLALQLGFSYNRSDPPIAEPGRFAPSARPGRRFPHGWLIREEGRVSALDLVDPAAFTIFCVRDSAPEPLPPSTVPAATVWLDTSNDSVRTWASAVGLRAPADVVVRPDGHILTVVGGATDQQSILRRIEAFVTAQCPPIETSYRS